ncbi:MAG: hypothetical protein E6R04_06500 [Spirochaetes bacterium]|nr:MAG: hypothetical protein E6R04_06500 [Spirochaetota bacterium]
MKKIVRIQDSEGRGPWRPGVSRLWELPSGPVRCHPVQEDFKNLEEIVSGAHRRKLHIGCAIRQNNIGRWFSRGELEKLYEFGFGWVDCEECEILAESKHQAVVASQKPLKYLPEALI